MGVVLMSKRELNRIDILWRDLMVGGFVNGRRADGGHSAADLPAFEALPCGGASAIANRRRGRPSNNASPVS